MAVSARTVEIRADTLSEGVSVSVGADAESLRQEAVGAVLISHRVRVAPAARVGERKRWALAVHKSQGSEFETVIVMLPAQLRGSRELLYTALTCQTKRVIICHEGSLADLLGLAAPNASDTARRFTDLVAVFRPASARDRNGQPNGVFDASLIHPASGPDGAQQERSHHRQPPRPPCTGPLGL